MTVYTAKGTEERSIIGSKKLFCLEGKGPVLPFPKLYPGEGTLWKHNGDVYIIKTNNDY